jgi:hypothetical protein
MATEVLNGPLGEWRAASTAAGGTALTSTAARIVLPIGTKLVQLIPRNYATAAVVKFNVNPWLTILKTTDLLAAEANITDYSVNAQDGSTATDVTLSGLDTVANLDAVYVGAEVPFSGIAVDVDAANGTASVLAVTYWDGSAWSDITPTDGTDAAGATFGQDGNITWTVPAGWASTALVDAVPTAKKNLGILTHPQFWVRIAVSAALDASTTQNSWLAINRDTTYAELPEGTAQEFSVSVGPGGVSSVTALTDAGTANLIVNCATRQTGRFA